VEDPDSFAGGYAIGGIVHDGTLLPAEPPMETLARGAYSRVPILLGTSRDEKKLIQALDPAFVRWRLGLFPYAPDPGHYDAAALHHARLCTASTVYVPAALLRTAQGPSVYAYRFDWDEEPRVPGLYDGPQLLGAAHGLVAPFVFGRFDLGPETRFIFGGGSRAGRELLASQIMSYWAEFAELGAPGRGRRGDLPEWTAWDPSAADAPKYLVLDTPAGGGLRMASETFTVEAAIAGLLADPRFPETRDRCAVLAEWSCVTREQYGAVEACRGYPLAAYPWKSQSSR
jgi:para-nitrobenzyl esterase